MNVLIVDDDADVRKSLASVLLTYDIQNLQAESASEALEMFDPAVIDCILADVLMPEINGITLMKLIRERIEDVPVIIMTGHADVPLAVQAMKEGAFDFLEKPIDDEILAERIAQACARKQNKTESEKQRSELVARFRTLTPQERQVAEMVAEGYSTAAIADILSISPRTVDHHRAKVLAKMRATTLPQLLKYLLRVFET